MTITIDQLSMTLNQIKDSYSQLQQNNSSLTNTNQSLLNKISILEAHISELEDNKRDLESNLMDSRNTIRKLENERCLIYDKYANLKKTAMQLEAFKKNIINMVEYTPSEPVLHDGSFQNDSLLEPTMGESLILNTIPPMNASQTHSSLLDPTTLYRQIRDSTSPKEFELFADIVKEFNNGSIGIEETLSKTKSIIKNSQLQLQFEELVLDALKE